MVQVFWGCFSSGRKGVPSPLSPIARTPRAPNPRLLAMISTQITNLLQYIENLFYPYFAITIDIGISINRLGWDNTRENLQCQNSVDQICFSVMGGSRYKTCYRIIIPQLSAFMKILTIVTLVLGFSLEIM